MSVFFKLLGARLQKILTELSLNKPKLANENSKINTIDGKQAVFAIAGNIFCLSENTIRNILYKKINNVFFEPFYLFNKTGYPTVIQGFDINSLVDSIKKYSDVDVRFRNRIKTHEFYQKNKEFCDILRETPVGKSLISDVET